MTALGPLPRRCGLSTMYTSAAAARAAALEQARFPVELLTAAEVRKLRKGGFFDSAEATMQTFDNEYREETPWRES